MSGKELAKAQGTSVSKFVAENVENVFCQEGGPGYKPCAELLREIHKLGEEPKEERKKNRRLDLIVDRIWWGELRRYMANPFLEEGFEDVRTLKKELVEMLRNGNILGNDEILSRLASNFFHQVSMIK